MSKRAKRWSETQPALVVDLDAARRNRERQDSDLVDQEKKSEKPVRRRKAKREAIKREKHKAFYRSWEWKKLRLVALQKHGRRCQCCGATPDDTTVQGTQVRLVVDHVKPISRAWDRRLDLNNLQVLCDECNMGKGSWSNADFRPA